MARATAPYPPEHDVALGRVLRVVDIIAAEPTIDDDAVVARLVGEGVGPVDAELLVRFVPCAMSFGMLKKLGVANFPSTYLLRAESGRWVEQPLAAEHYFTAALQLGFDIVTHGYTERVGREAFQTVTLRSADGPARHHTGAGRVQPSVGPAAVVAVLGVSRRRRTNRCT